MKKQKIMATVALAVLLALLCACSNDNQPQNPAPPTGSQTQNETSGEVIITFNFEKQSGRASNQFAVWIEDTGGNHVKTLYATHFTAGGGYKDRPDSIPTWVEKSGLATMTKSEVDAISGATPKVGTLTYSWDLTDANGDTVSLGDYMFFIEGSLRWKNRVLYSGMISVGDSPVTVQAESEFFYEASDSQPALSDDSPETEMIGAVTASYKPAAAD